MMIKIGKVWVSVDSSGYVVKVHGPDLLTGVKAKPFVCRSVVVNPADLKDPFEIVLKNFGLTK